MSKLKIKNFGPITTGYASEDGFMDFHKVTVFIGSQGSGKSSVAKLFSTMSWLEKALFQGRVTADYITRDNLFVNEYCAYMNLKSYFRTDTLIEYQGRVGVLRYEQQKLTVKLHQESTGYRVPKIMYVPAERNFLSAVDEPDKLKGLPSALLEFWEELRRAQRETTNSLPLPVGNLRFDYDKSEKIPWLSGKTAGQVDFRLRLSEASSGFQSLVPLLLVSRNLALAIHKEHDASRSELSGEERRRLRQQVDAILKANLPLEVQQEALESLAARFRRETFLNVVEEPEQNLFPASQRVVLYELLSYANTTPGNELVITTHSPYIINYLTLAIKADEVKNEVVAAPHHAQLRKQLNTIVPDQAILAAGSTVVYALTSAGTITRLPMDGGIPSDENDLNNALGEANAHFSDLLEIELAALNA